VGINLLKRVGDLEVSFMCSVHVSCATDAPSVTQGPS
jgi:hypothetical protein